MNSNKNIVQIYYDRDKHMNINNNNHIHKSLRKLGYYNINKDDEDKKLYIDQLSKKIINEFDNDWKVTIKNKTINDFLPFNDVNPSLTNRIERSIILSKHLDKDDTLEFYNDLTQEELEYLGY